MSGLNLAISPVLSEIAAEAASGPGPVRNEFTRLVSGRPELGPIIVMATTTNEAGIGILVAAEQAQFPTLPERQLTFVFQSLDNPVWSDPNTG